MYNSQRFPKLVVLWLLFGVFSLASYAEAQNLNAQLAEARQAMESRNVQKAHMLYERITTAYDKRAPMLYGPRFGFMWYQQGICELKLANEFKRKNQLDEASKWFSKAASSFETCYTKYPDGAPGMAPSNNIAHKASIQRWAEAMMGLQDYDKAIQLYQKFQTERKQGDKFLPTPGGFYINLAICNFLMKDPKIPDGIRQFETAIKNKVKMRTSNSGIVAAFLALSQAVIDEENEAAMVDFLEKNRADISMPAYQFFEYNPVFLKLAGTALKSKMYEASFNLYAMIPDTKVVIADIESRIDQLSGRRGIKDGEEVIQTERLKTSLAKLKNKLKTGDPDEVKALTAMAYLHDQAGNQRGVLGALEQLELYYNKSKKREVNLFSLVRVSSILGDVRKMEQYGRSFLNDYPSSDKVDVVSRMMLSSLFFAGRYEASLEIAEKYIETAAKPSDQHDVCLFVLGGSHFYLGDFEKAQPLLEQHTKDYPDSKLIMHSEYFLCSNLGRLQNWEKAAGQLDRFLEKYSNPSENVYFANALYDRANCHFSNNEFDQALTLLNRIEDEFPSSSVVNLAFNMKGQIFESRSEYDKAEKYYEMVLENASKRGEKLIAGEALSYLVGMLGSEKLGNEKEPNPRLKDAAAYYDRFMKDYSDSPYKPQVVVYGMHAMKSVGREDDGLKNLKALITELSNDERQFFLEEVVNAFSEAFLDKEGNTPEMLKELYYNFPGIDFGNKRALALLRVAIIGIFEDEIKKAEKAGEGERLVRLKADIGALFTDLKTQFQPKDLTNFVLVRVGDYLREKTSAPKQSIPYYEELLSRDKRDNLELKSQLGIADVLGRSASLSDNKKALSQLKEIVKLADEDKTTMASALFRIVEISAKMGDWSSVEESSRKYLENQFTKKAPEVSYLYALSFDKREKLNDALVFYGMVYSRYKGFIRISAPATKRVMQILWERNLAKGDNLGETALEIADRQAAYSEIGYKYLLSTRNIRENNTDITDAEKEQWDEVQALVKEYESSGQVKTWAVLEEERLENLRRGRR